MNDDCWPLLRGLFPKWEPTMEEAALFRRAFSSRSSTLLRVAIEDYRTFYKYREPNLGSILTKYSELARKRTGSSPVVDGDAESEAEDRAAYEASNRRIAHDVELLDDEAVGQILSEIRKMSSLAMFVARLSDDRERWTPFQRGLVWAKASEIGLLAGASSSTRPRSLSQDQD